MYSVLLLHVLSTGCCFCMLMEQHCSSPSREPSPDTLFAQTASTHTCAHTHTHTHGFYTHTQLLHTHGFYIHTHTASTHMASTHRHMASTHTRLLHTHTASTHIHTHGFYTHMASTHTHTLCLAPSSLEGESFSFVWVCVHISVQNRCN